MASTEVRREIGRRLKEARAAMKLTQAQVASELGVNRQSVSAWEQGKDMPRSEAWFQIGPLYGVSLDYLVYGIRTIPESKSELLLKCLFRPRAEASA